MKQTHLLAMATAFLAFATTSCFDDKYDLSDIDKTVQVSVDKLVVPINVDQVSLSSVIDETSNIKVIDGQYAYVTDGDFDSDPITVEGISVKIDKIDDSHVTIKNALGGMPNPDVDIDYDIAEDDPSPYTFKSENISDDLYSLDRIDGDSKLTITLDLHGLKGFATKAMLKGVKIDLPKRMITVPHPDGVYDFATGVFTLKDQLVDVNAGLQVVIDIIGLDIAEGEFNPTDHTLNIKGDVGLSDGIFQIPAQYQSQTLPERLSIAATYDITDFEVKTVTGDFKYDLDNVDIPEVNLDDLPDFLNQEGTNLILANPQLYLRANNPLNMYEGVYAQTSISIEAYRDKAADDKSFALDKPFKIGGVKDVNEFDYVLSPEKPGKFDASYPNPSYVPFTDLGFLLSGNGLPKRLKVSLVDPMVPRQHIVGFEVGKSYAAVEGTWKFVAPFALKAGSCIMYSDVVDGWSSEDLDKVTITYLEVSVNVSTNIPVGVQFTGQPLGKNGKPIAGTKITGATIKPMAKGEAVTIKVEMPAGGIKDLDGIKFEAVATAEDGPALSPDMKIDLTNIRPCVSGYYQTEL